MVYFCQNQYILDLQLFFCLWKETTVHKHGNDALCTKLKAQAGDGKKTTSSPVQKQMIKPPKQKSIDPADKSSRKNSSPAPSIHKSRKKKLQQLPSPSRGAVVLNQKHRCEMFNQKRI